MDKNNSSPWGPVDDLVERQRAWGTGQDLPLPTSANLLKSDEPSEDGDVAHSELHAILGSGTSFHGTLSYSGQVRIDGEFAGQILGGRVLVVGDGARIQGEIRARRVIILGGNVKADIYATEMIELHVPAQVTGDLQAPEIHMDRGVKFQGTCDLSEPTGF